MVRTVERTPKHPPKVLVVVEDQAAVVRGIFELYVSGEGLRSIAHRLNAKLAAAPPAHRLGSSPCGGRGRVLEIRGAFAGNDSHRRTALRALLCGRRLQVAPDPDRGFRVDGLLEVVLETNPPPQEGRGGGLWGSGGTMRVRDSHPGSLHSLAGGRLGRGDRSVRPRRLYGLNPGRQRGRG
jgi:hypothetical protein